MPTPTGPPEDLGLLREGLYVSCVHCGDKREFVQRKALRGRAYTWTASKGTDSKACARVKGHVWVRVGQGHDCLQCGLVCLSMAGARRMARCASATGEVIRGLNAFAVPTGSVEHAHAEH